MTREVELRAEAEGGERGEVEVKSSTRQESVVEDFWRENNIFGGRNKERCTTEVVEGWMDRGGGRMQRTMQ